MPKEIKNKKTYYSQKYTKVWETDPELKGWLAPDVTNDTLATCKYCRVVLKAHKKDDLHPKVATSQAKPDLKQILNHIHRTHVYGNKSDIETEWQQLSNKIWTNTTTSADFYYEVYNDMDAAGCKRFENVAKLGLAFVTIPISNASVERAFSIYNIVKNKLRNRLSIEMLQSIMMIRFTLIRNGGSCTTFNPSSKMLSLFNVKMYDFKNSDSSEDINTIFNVLEHL